jgi:hypothetical protein
MSFFDRLRAGLRRSRPGEAQAFVAKGRKIVCAHCAHDRFVAREALLNTAVATFFNVDWLNRSGTALTCAHCGLIQWFAQRPDVLTTP